VLALLFFAPEAARALELSKYDSLSIKDKALYDEMLIRGSETFLRREGKKDMADKLVSTFDVLQPGRNISAGMEQLGREIQAAQSYQIRTGKLLHIEHVMLVALKKFGIEIPQSEMMSFAKDFRPAGGK
jgi:hypothetical protein